MPKVTIALATCNGARYLDEQIASIRSQTFADFEVLVGDDVSDDDTLAILQRHAAEDFRITILQNGSRKGLQRNFENLIAMARGEWIAPCDQDDIWESDKLAVLLEAAGKSDVVMVYSDSRLIDANGNLIGRNAFDTMTPVDGARTLVFAFTNCVSGHAMLFHRRLREVALPFPDVPIYDWWLAAAASSVGRIVRVDRPLVRYRQHGASVTDMGKLRPKAKSHSVDKMTRRLIRDLQVRERLAAFARLPGPLGADYRRLADLWERYLTGSFAFPLAFFAWRHRHELWAIKPGHFFRDLVRAAKLSIGWRWWKGLDIPLRVGPR